MKYRVSVILKPIGAVQGDLAEKIGNGVELRIGSYEFKPSNSGLLDQLEMTFDRVPLFTRIPEDQMISLNSAHRLWDPYEPAVPKEPKQESWRDRPSYLGQA